MKHLFIVNPVAGGKKNRAPEIIEEIKTVMADVDEKYEIFVSEHRYHACEKIALDAETEDDLRVYACGGDGTFNECVNSSALKENVSVACYPCGTGNDFVKTFGDDKDRFTDMRALVKGSVVPIDIIKCGKRWCANICSVGIDARIGTDVHKYSHIPLIGGAAGYVISLFVNVFKGISTRMKVSSEGYSYDGDVTLICACNGRYYGGGFNPTTEAEVDDGVLDVLVADKVGILAFFAIVMDYAKGKYAKHPDHLTYLKTRSITVEAENEFVVNIDGEAEVCKKVTFEIFNHGLNFICPDGVKMLGR